MKKLGLAIAFAAGLFLAATSNLQLSLGILVMLLSYVELRKIGIDISQIDDILLEKLSDITKDTSKNE